MRGCCGTATIEEARALQAPERHRSVGAAVAGNGNGAVVDSDDDHTSFQSVFRSACASRIGSGVNSRGKILARTTRGVRRQ